MLAHQWWARAAIEVSTRRARLLLKLETAAELPPVSTSGSGTVVVGLVVGLSVVLSGLLEVVAVGFSEGVLLVGGWVVTEGSGVSMGCVTLVAGGDVEEAGGAVVGWTEVLTATEDDVTGAVVVVVEEGREVGRGAEGWTAELDGSGSTIVPTPS